jgi:hypothetical protein
MPFIMALFELNKTLIGEQEARLRVLLELPAADQA